jgi:general stress protein 26
MNEVDAKETIWGHVTNISTCMMVARDGDWVRARPMRGIAKPDENEIWFITDRETSIGSEVSDDPRCCLTYCDTKTQAYVSLSGQMSVVDDPSVLGRLWSEGAEAYFPHGPNDPAAILLKFVPEIAQYWETPSSPILIAINFLQAKLTGQRPELGSSGTARLS